MTYLHYGTQIPAGLTQATVVAAFDVETYSEAGYEWNGDRVDSRTGRSAPRWQTPKGVSGKPGLFCVNAAVYTAHPSARLLTLSYDLKDGRGKRRWKPGLPLPQDLFDFIAAGGLVESHYAGFEFWVWWNILHKRLGWPMIPHAQQRCSMAKARAWGLPGGLGDLGAVLNTHTQKDKEGKRLLEKFSIPRSPTISDTRLRILPEEDPEDAEKLERYCDTDVATESEVSELIPDLDPVELEWWQHDQLINRLGVQVDVPTIRAAIRVIEEAFERYNGELRELTGGAVQRASELAKLQTWLHAQGVQMYSMSEEAIDEVLSNEPPPELAKDVALLRLDREYAERNRNSDSYVISQYAESMWPAIKWLEKHDLALPSHCRRALEIRQLIGSAAVKKLYALDRHALDSGRVHELFTYFGARTGRATGNGPQPTNLPNSGPETNVCVACRKHYGLHKSVCPWCFAPKMLAPPHPLPNKAVVEWCAEAAADAIEIIASGSLDAVETFFDDALEVVAASLRGMFIAAPGGDLVSADYSAIEAVVLAELAGEQWRIDLFRAGGKIYEASGAKVAGIPYEETTEYKARTGQHHPVRKKGKIMELALGYQGWIGAMKNFGAGEWMTEDEMKDAIIAWRTASPMIVEFWGGQFRGLPWGDRKPDFFGLEGKAMMAVLNPGQAFSYRGITYQMRGDVLYCTLLSGRRLAYHRPRLRKNERDRWGDSLALSFEGWNSNPKKGAPGWIRMDLYGGLLTENVVQATARDVLIYAIVKLWAAGYRTVLHVYDEIVAEIARGWGSIEEFCRIMGELPPWACNAVDGLPWPIRVSGAWRGERYRK